MLNLSQIHERIEACDARMQYLVEEVVVAAGDAAVTEASFKASFARERLRARSEARDRKITTDEAEDRATVATADLRSGYLLASNNLTVLREALRACQSQMDGLRSIAASHRAGGG